MKVVDVISTKVYSDSQQIIAQVMNLFVWSASVLVFFISCFMEKHCISHLFYVYLQLH